MDKDEIIRLLKSTTNVYADESSHMDDGSTFMVLGAIWMDSETTTDFTARVKEIKVRHEIPLFREIKWTKVSQAKLDYYKELVDLFTSYAGVNYRAVIADKTKLDHERFGHTRDDFYYIMQYYLIRNIAEKCLGKIKIYLDYKDTWSGPRCHKLADYLNHTAKIKTQGILAQPIRSYESAALQLADLISGALMYANKERSEEDSSAKLSLVEYIESKLQINLKQSTQPSDEKFNIFFWEARD